MKSTPEKQQYDRERRKAITDAGLCSRCRNPSDAGKMCAACRAVTYQKTNMRRKQKIIDGKCPCGRVRDRDGVYCRRCLKDFDGRSKISGPKAYWSAINAGLCVGCRLPNDKPTVLCSKCSDKERAGNLRYVTAQRKTNAQVRLAKNLRENLRNLLKGVVSVSVAIGCTTEQLREYVEARFLPGMHWGNYGKFHGNWNMDHIIPLSSVDLTDTEAAQKVCHYTNTRPMWHVENIRKGKAISQ